MCIHLTYVKMKMSPPTITKEDRQFLAAAASLAVALNRLGASIRVPDDAFVNEYGLDEVTLETAEDACLRARIEAIAKLEAIPSPAIRRVLEADFASESKQAHYRIGKLSQTGAVEKQSVADDVHAHSQMIGIVLTEEGWNMAAEHDVDIWRRPEQSVAELQDRVATLEGRIDELEHAFSEEQQQRFSEARKQEAIITYLRELDQTLFAPKDGAIKQHSPPDSQPWKID
jgi:hypothetical protein